VKKLLFAVLLSLFASSAFAVYNADMSGELEGVYIYTDSDRIHLRLLNQPTSHPACSSVYFVSDDRITADRRKAILARLLTAYATHEVINIGYDSTGDCADGFLRVHRAG